MWHLFMGKSKSSSEKNKNNSAQDQNIDSRTERFNLIILKSERLRMAKLQGKCFRKNRVCNLSEIMRAGITAMEKLPDSEIETIIENLEDL